MSKGKVGVKYEVYLDQQEKLADSRLREKQCLIKLNDLKQTAFLFNVQLNNVTP